MAMLGAKCSPCCKDTDTGPCSCVEGELPATVTVSLSGPMGTKEQGPNLLPLSFTSCFGSGAEGHAVAPGGTPGEDNGPISSAALTKQGSGYAVLGREAPSLSLGNDNSTPADVTITLHEYTDSCGRPLWRVDSISVNDDGEGYIDGDALVITAAEGTTVVTEATGKITIRYEPTIEVTTEDGTGAEFTVAVEQTKAEPSTWTITGVTFTGDTSGYVDGQSVTFGGEYAVEVEPAAAVIRTVRVKPTVAVVADSAGGTGAVLTATLAANGTTPETWRASEVFIDYPGTGYGQGQIFLIAAVDGVAASQAPVIIQGTDQDGGITAVDFEVGNRGEYYKPTDELHFIELTEGGEWSIGEIVSIAVTDGGVYYAEDDSLPAIVADIEVKVNQLWPSEGSGAELSAVVDDTPGSATFGQITSVTVDDGGENYLGWRWIYACDCEWGGDNGSGNGIYGHTVVAWKSSECSYTGYRCWPDGPTEEPVFGLLRVRLVSDIKTASIPISAPGGMPGRDGGPVSIDGILEFSAAAALSSGWAYVDEETGGVVAPEITVTIEQSAPSDGSGATITATIDTDKDSQTFGRVTLTLASGGDGYLGDATGWNGVTVEYRGPSLPPLVTDYASNCAPCSTTLTSNTLINDCSNFSFTATFGEATAEVSPGGSITPVFEGPNKCCGRCYNKCPDRPSQLTVTFSREGNSGDALDDFFIDCPEHQVEVVFDFEDLESDRECGPFYVCIANFGVPDFDCVGQGPGGTVEGCVSPWFSAESPSPICNGIEGENGTLNESTWIIFRLDNLNVRCVELTPSISTRALWWAFRPIDAFSKFEYARTCQAVTYTPGEGKRCLGGKASWRADPASLPPESPAAGDEYGGFTRICNSYEIDWDFS